MIFSIPPRSPTFYLFSDSTASRLTSSSGGCRLLLAIVAAGCLQQASATARAPVNCVSTANFSCPGHFHTVLLQKQYVPVHRDGKIAAYKTSYFGDIEVGGPERQAFTVVFDTGSGNLILPSSHCRSEACGQHQRFDREASQSSVDINHDGTPVTPDAGRDSLAISFGTGQVEGELVEDTVFVGGAAVKLRVVLASEMSEEPFSRFAFDGVLGLGLDALTVDPQFSFFGQMVKQRPDLKPQFAVFLAKREGGVSQITFGGYDPRRAASEVHWASVVRQELGYWQVQVKSVRIGDHYVEACEDGTCTAIVDTGASLLGVPRPAVKAMHSMLARPLPEGAPPSVADCRAIPGPSIHFDLGGPVVSVLPEDYSRPRPISTLASGKAGARSHLCRAVLLPMEQQAQLGPKTFILGEPVLRRYYTVYDLAKKQIGFALAKDPPEAEVGLPSVGLPPAGSTLAGAPLPPLRRASVASAGNG